MNGTRIMSEIDIRWMIRRDYDPCVAVDQACFDDPWTPDNFFEHLTTSNIVCVVAERINTSEIIGYMVYRLAETELTIVRMAVLPDEQRGGIGERFVARLKARLSRLKRRRIICDVPERLLDTQLFLQSMDFRCIDNRNDVYRFAHYAFVRPSIRGM